MIASVNFTSLSALECLNSSLHNKYSEGCHGQTYYDDNQFIDEAENSARSRALEVYKLKPEERG